MGSPRDLGACQKNFKIMNFSCFFYFFEKTKEGFEHVNFFEYVIRYTNIEETKNIQTNNFWGKLDENHPSIHYCLQKLTIMKDLGFAHDQRT
jgi:hypothetical protein